ncbi:MAG: hypothetical protein O2955_21185 [Planctomycetota bacterium]|nr:hypothetical protein [Planctomycetota bacterium]MDA1215024.1 hypothetical protein [Planctomycetota bacterium]
MQHIVCCITELYRSPTCLKGTDEKKTGQIEAVKDHGYAKIDGGKKIDDGAKVHCRAEKTSCNEEAIRTEEAHLKSR